jgi:hypothetical protein
VVAQEAGVADHERVTRPVKLLDIVGSDPPAILTYEQFPLPSGGMKGFTQEVPVLDRALFERLLREAAVGDEVEITVVTEWGTPGAPHYLADFVRIAAPVAPTEARRQ